MDACSQVFLLFTCILVCVRGSRAGAAAAPQKANPCLGCVWLCHVMERKSRILYPYSLAHSHSADEMPQRRKRTPEMEGKNCGETLKEWRRRIGGEVNREDKEVEGGGGDRSMIKERNHVSVFLNLEMLNPFFSLQPAFLGH
ncbi:unnamed protein product [Tetraodon nigroviridis]|uniref:(spotted green pufferfish) hypothetical protein n=1 Tax=Tetraodon nigroviridis TaxID=99883 RepID=Q4RUL7_TETNG|nr:unnamed protein product [Tetraodon nigroviridis]